MSVDTENMRTWARWNPEFSVAATLVEAADELDLLRSILRKAADTMSGCFIVERYEKGGISGLIDSGWFNLTDAEADYVDRMKAELDASQVAP